MGLFDIFKKKNREAPPDECVLFARKMSTAAVEYGKSFHKNLDYSAKSIADLEEILDWYAKDLEKSSPTQNQIWSMAVIFGSYLGETMLKNGLADRGFVWKNEPPSKIPLLYAEEKGCLTPNDRVYKRLVSGSAESVISFYEFSVNL